MLVSSILFLFLFFSFLASQTIQYNGSRIVAKYTRVGKKEDAQPFRLGGAVINYV